MPRKPKLYPQPLRVEAMSTGLPVYADDPMVDDFSGEPLQRLRPPAEPKAIPSADVVLRKAREAKGQEARAILTAAGIAVPAGLHSSAASEPAGPRRDTQTRLRISLKRKDWRRI